MTMVEQLAIFAGVEWEHHPLPAATLLAQDEFGVREHATTVARAVDVEDRARRRFHASDGEHKEDYELYEDMLEYIEELAKPRRRLAVSRSR
jgi:hypothetical protein